MLDQTSPDTVRQTHQNIAEYDLIVVGAGIAGLNALYAAIDYLPKTARVMLIDQKHTAGGMWNSAYEYVRLHQPHPMFTVGDMKWNWRKPRSYLARRDEVRDHLASSLGTVSEAVNFQPEFGQTMITCEEVSTDRGFRGRVTFHPNDNPNELRTVEAHRVLYAPGLDYRKAEPLQFSSKDVNSIIPQDLSETLSANPTARVYVVGGGKTAMDTVLAALAQDPERNVTLINGRGTNFINRDKYLPNGLRRWTSGMLTSRLFRDLALSFDGTNEVHTIAHLRKQHSTDPDSPNGVFLYGLQSKAEQSRIASGLSQIRQDYLMDVTEGQNGPCLEFRSGSTEPIPGGSIIVNCTGSFFRASKLAVEIPFLSPHQSILSINMRDTFHFLSSVAGFFATHLIYRGELRGKEFYTLDHEALFRKDRNAWVGASAAQAYMNQVIATQVLPMQLLDRCGLDFDRWYPLPRRMLGLMRMKATAAEDIAHCRASLDRVADRFDVHAAPLS